MDLKNLASKAKQMMDKRGGADSAKEDAGELKDIATGPGSLKDKATEAVAAVKDPGAEEPAAAAASAGAGRRGHAGSTEARAGPGRPAPREGKHRQR